MCDILRRLASPELSKQQYLSSLNEFSRLCRAKRKEELFQLAGRLPASGAVNSVDSIRVDGLTTVHGSIQEDHQQHDGGDDFSKEETAKTDPSGGHKQADQTLTPDHSLVSCPDQLATDASRRNPIFKLNRADENDVFTMDDVFRW